MREKEIDKWQLMNDEIHLNENVQQDDDERDVL